MQLYERKVNVIVGGSQFDMPGFKIDFEVVFDAEGGTNSATVSIYNLKKSTMNSINKGDAIRINAGYNGRVHTIFQGVVSDLMIEYADVDVVLSILAVDEPESESGTFNRYFIKTFNKKIYASEIIQSLADGFGVAIGTMNLRADKYYASGRTVEGTFSEVLSELANECESTYNIDAGVIYINPLRHTNDAYNIFKEQTVVILNKSTGLLGTPSMRQEDTTEELDMDALETVNIRSILAKAEYDVFSLLNNELRADKMVNISSNTANGDYLILDGKHICNDGGFQTYIHVEAFEESQEDIPTTVSN